jgi:ectoine hydroxylase-related dioxygenase (phytanoyl-CoA dioxygenase family)
MMKFINEDQRKLYWAQGFLVVEEFFAPKESERIYNLLRKVATKNFDVFLNMDRSEDLLKQSPDSAPLAREAVSKAIREVQLDARMVGILEELYEREMTAVQSLIIYKEKGTPFADQAWNPHQDNSYTRNPNGLYIAVGYPLLGLSPENGGLYFYPGSHKEEILPFEPVEGARQKAGANPGNCCLPPEKYKKMDITLNKGDAVIFHGNLVHGSYANLSERSRPFLVVNYIPDGEYFIAGNTSKRKMIKCH